VITVTGNTRAALTLAAEGVAVVVVVVVEVEVVADHKTEDRMTETLL